MTYFLGRDVDLYLTQESAVGQGSGDADEQYITVSSGEVTFVAQASATSPTIPCMGADSEVREGVINDVTGIDLSIAVSDEDVGPFLGNPQIMQKVELRKETVVTITKKKQDNFFDAVFNGPTATASFAGGSNNAARMGARFGVTYLGGGTNIKISDGAEWMPDVLETGSTTETCYGYRLHMVLKNTTSGELFTVRNAVMTGHTVTLNADGVQEETIEFTSSVAPTTGAPSNASGDTTGFDVSPTLIAEL